MDINYKLGDIEHIHIFKPPSIIDSVISDSFLLSILIDSTILFPLRLHNVDQIDDSQWLCTKETYQNINLYMCLDYISIIHYPYKD